MMCEARSKSRSVIPVKAQRPCPKRLPFYRHQGQAFAKARAGQSFVVTTGTGSGKSLCFFVPIVDAIIRARKAGITFSPGAVPDS